VRTVSRGSSQNKSSEESSCRYSYPKHNHGGPEIYTDTPPGPSLNEFDAEESKKEIVAHDGSSFRLDPMERNDTPMWNKLATKKPAAPREVQFNPDQNVPRKPPPQGSIRRTKKPPIHHPWQQPVKKSQSPSGFHLLRILEVRNSKDGYEDLALCTPGLRTHANLVWWSKGEEAKKILQHAVKASKKG
jgi:hypothetical protein